MTGPTEADLAAVVVAWLVETGYDVYQEVELVPRGIRADIVARRSAELTIVETKTSGSLALIGQVMERRRFAHRVYLACPHPSIVLRDVGAELGIGVLAVRAGTDARYDTHRVVEQVASRRWNTRPLKLSARLRPEHKTACAAGSPTGGHWSRWRDTCAQIEAVARANPGIALRQAVAQVQHHYASGRGAVASLAECIRRGAVPGLRLEAGALRCVDAGGEP